MDKWFSTGSSSILARCVAAEIRARLAAQRKSGKWLAEQIGLSQNYVAKRLRDEAPFTLDDIELIVEAVELGSDPHDFIVRAFRRHNEEIYVLADGPITTMKRRPSPR